MKKIIAKIFSPWGLVPLIMALLCNFVVYSGCNALTRNWNLHSLAIPLDKQIPLIPWTIVIYFGCYIFWIIGYLYNAAMDKRHCYRFLMADWLAKAVCFICYVVYPTTNTRPEIVGSDIWAQLMRFLYSMDAADNLFPSIHCLVSWLCYIGIRGNKKVPQWIRTTFCICAIAVFISTLTTKQHVIYDVVAGVALVEVTYRVSKLIVKRQLKRENRIQKKHNMYKKYKEYN